MADTSLIIGNGNWAVKETSLLGYNIIQSKYVPIEMTVVRATTATRVNSAGLIEVVPINLLTYSEQFDNAAWTKVGSTISANSTTAPNGTTTADKLIEDTSNGLHNAARIGAMASAGTYTLSVFAKAAERTRIAIGNSSASNYAIFDLSTGTVVQGSQGTVTNGAISSIDANGYYRVSCNITITSSSSISVSLVSTGTTTSYLGNGTSGLFIWGAQLVTGTSAKEYFPTTDRFNIPRVDYSTGTASLLVEPARTNLVLYSEQFDNVYWTKQELTLTANSIISPDGTLNAYKLTPTTVSSPHQLNRLSISTSVSNTMSFYAKKGGYDLVECLDGASGFNGSKFNLNTGTFTNQGTGVGSMISVGNGWYRCVVTVVTTGIRFYINNSSSYIGDGTSGIYLWGVQYETAAFNATSYIPTVAATVTRNADVISKTGISSLIGQTEGTLYAEVNITTFNNGVFFSINDGTSANRIQMYKFTDNKIYCDRISATQSVTTSISSSALSVGTYKVAFAYQSGNSYLYINGAQVGATSAATFTFGSMGKVNIGSNYVDISTFNDRIESATLFPTRLTNAQLATLTTI